MYKTNLTIENFLNEMSYDLNEVEYERAVIKYQDVLIRYFTSSQWVRSEKKNFHEACSIVRSEKFLDMLEYLMDEKTEEVYTDMAFVIMSASKFGFVEDDVKLHVSQLSFKLRQSEYEDVKLPELKNIATVLSGWVVKEIKMNDFVRVKCMEMIIEKLPRALALSFGNKLEAKQLSDKHIFTIIKLISNQIHAEDVIKALLKSEFKYEKDDKAYPYAARLKSFLYSMIEKFNGRQFQEILKSVSLSFHKFNKGENKITFKDSYLDIRLITNVVNSNEMKEKKPQAYKSFKETYEAIERFKMENPNLKYLF